MSVERHGLAEVVIKVKLLIKRNLVKGEGRSTSGLLVILAHGETATAKKSDKSVINDNGEDLQHQKENTIQIKIPHMMRSPTTQAIGWRDAGAEKMSKLQTIHTELLQL